VIADGRVVDRTYHAWYRSPFGGDGPVTLPVVDDIGWALNLRRQNPGFGGPPAPAAPQAAEGRGQRGQRGQAAEGGGQRGQRGGAQQAAAAAPLPPGPGGARQPQPTIETIDSGRKDYADPDFSKVVVKEGGPSLNFKITGFNYFQRSQVYFNNIPVPTRVISRFEIEAMIDESLLRTPGRYPIVVKNLGLADPANTRIGDGTSNTGWLIVNYR
jgi:hypothetical protein